MKLNKYLLATVIVAAAAITTAAQTMTPYSRYGYGQLSDNATSMQRAMGGVGYAMNSGRQINVMNPASYANVDSLTFLFDIGADVTMLWSKDGDKTGHSSGGGLDYITMLFPVTKYLGVSVGLLPYSSVGYSFGTDIENGEALRSGSGSLNQVYLGVGGKVFKGLTLGANVSYLFGTTYNELYANSDGGSSALFQRVLEVRDYHLGFGAQYTLNIGKRDRLSLGLSYTPKQGLLGHTWGTYYDVNNSAKVDTVGYSSLKGNYSLSESWGAGVAYHWNNRLLAEMDFTYQPWSKAKYAALQDFESTRFTDRYKIAGGLQWTPAPRGSYLKRCQYRIGGYYDRDYLTIRDNKINEVGVSAGIGFPAPGTKTIINLGFEYKHRQGTPEKLVSENYFNITLGVNFNEMWFWRNKIR